MRATRPGRGQGHRGVRRATRLSAGDATASDPRTGRATSGPRRRPARSRPAARRSRASTAPAGRLPRRPSRAPVRPLPRSAQPFQPILQTSAASCTSVALSSPAGTAWLLGNGVQTIGSRLLPALREGRSRCHGHGLLHASGCDGVSVLPFSMLVRRALTALVSRQADRPRRARRPGRLRAPRHVAGGGACSRCHRCTRACLDSDALEA